MPFRPENRMITFLVFMLFLFACLGGGLIVISEYGGRSSTPINVFVGAVIVLVIKDLIWQIHAIIDRNRIAKNLVVHDQRADERGNLLVSKIDELERKTNGNLKEETERVRSAERAQMLDDPEFVGRLAAQVASLFPCDQIAEQAAIRAVELYRNGMR
jgi:hypothetical protein